MTTRAEAEDHLRVIRSLMEKSTIYRAISAPTALVGGILALVAFVIFELIYKSSQIDIDRLSKVFLIVWFSALFLTLTANSYFIWSGAKKRGEPFISSGMKLAMISLLPNILCATLFTFLLTFCTSINVAFLLPYLWMLFYGLGLLSTAHFAPRSIVLLGWAFLISVMSIIILFRFSDIAFLTSHNPFHVANYLMVATFGGFHIIYAFCTWPRRSAAADAAGNP